MGVLQNLGLQLHRFWVFQLEGRQLLLDVFSGNLLLDGFLNLGRNLSRVLLLCAMDLRQLGRYRCRGKALRRRARAVGRGKAQAGRVVAHRVQVGHRNHIRTLGLQRHVPQAGRGQRIVVGQQHLAIHRHRILGAREQLGLVVLLGLRHSLRRQPGVLLFVEPGVLPPHGVGHRLDKFLALGLHRLLELAALGLFRFVGAGGLVGGRLLLALGKLFLLAVGD